MSEKRSNNWNEWRALFKKTFITEVSPSEVVQLFRDLTMKDGDAVALFHSKVEIAMDGMDDTLPTRDNTYYEAFDDKKSAYEAGLETYKTAFRRVFWQLGITKSFTAVIAKLPKNATEDQIVDAAVAHERESLEIQRSQSGSSRITAKVSTVSSNEPISAVTAQNNKPGTSRQKKKLSTSQERICRRCHKAGHKTEYSAKCQFHDPNKPHPKSQAAVATVCETANTEEDFHLGGLDQW